MSNPLVGGARVEVTGDLDKFASNTERQIRDALRGVTRVTETEMGRTEQVMSQAGERGGRRFGEQAGRGVQSSGRGVRDAARRVGQESESALAERGRQAGEKFGEGAKEGIHHMGAAIFGGIGAVGIGEFVAKGLEAADQLEAANIKIEGAFGESSDSVHTWAQTMATQLGQSAKDAENAAGTFGQMFHAMGIGQEEAAGMSEHLDMLVQNVAKFNNADPVAVQQAFQAAMRGRGKALLQLGINLDSTTLAAQALSHHIVANTVDQGKLTAAQDAYSKALAAQQKIDKDTNATALQRKLALDATARAHASLDAVMKGHLPTLTQSQKGEAAYYAILASTKNQENAVADSAHTLAQQKKILGAEVTDLEAKFGTMLLPVLTKVAETVTRDLVPDLQATGKWIKQNRDWLEPLAMILGSAAVAWKVMGVATKLYGVAGREVTAVMRMLGLATAAQTTEQEGLNVAMEANPIGLVVAVIAALAAGVYLAYRHFQPFHDIVDATGRMFASHLGPAMRDVEQVGLFLWRNVLEPLSKFLLFGFKVGLVVIIAEFVAARLAVNLVRAEFLFLWHYVLEPLATLLRVGARLAWVGIRLEFQLVRAEVMLLRDLFLFVWHNVIHPLAEALSGPFHTALHGIRDVVHWVVTGTKAEWDAMGDIFRKPINAVLGFISHFDSDVDDITDKVGLGRPLPTGLHLRAGGRVPGSGDGDIVPAMLEPGEYVLPKALTQRLGEKFLDQLRAQAAGPINRDGVLYAAGGGGIDWNPVHAARGAASSIGSAAKWAAGAGTHLFRAGAADAVSSAFHSLIGPLMGDLAGSGLVGQMTLGAANSIGNGVVAWIRGHTASAGSAGGPLSGDHRALIDQALRLAGQQVNAGNEVDVNLIVSRESGWNPSAINLTDSNAAAGHPSQGLMQTIPSTFAAYGLPGLGGILDPVANLVAGIRYAVSRYGSLDNVPGVAAVNAGGAYVGYDNGGPILPGFSHIFNGTGKVEHALTDDVMQRLIAVLEALAGPTRVIDANGDYFATLVNNTNLERSRGA